MGKPTGFMEYERELPQDRSPLERVKDWNEFHEHFSQDKLQRAGRALHGLRHSILPYRPIDQRHGFRLSGQ